jgi:hypothetical protein
MLLMGDDRNPVIVRELPQFDGLPGSSRLHTGVQQRDRTQVILRGWSGTLEAAYHADEV